MNTQLPVIGSRYRESIYKEDRDRLFGRGFPLWQDRTLESPETRQIVSVDRTKLGFSLKEELPNEPKKRKSDKALVVLEFSADRQRQIPLVMVNSSFNRDNSVQYPRAEVMQLEQRWFDCGKYNVVMAFLY